MAFSLTFRLPDENHQEKQNPPGVTDVRIRGLSGAHVVAIEGYGDGGWVSLASIKGSASGPEATATITVPTSRRVRAFVSNGGKALVMFLD